MINSLPMHKVDEDHVLIGDSIVPLMPSARLRWVYREIPNSYDYKLGGIRVDKVLQQAMMATSTQNGLTQTYIEWRDIPIEKSP